MGGLGTSCPTSAKKSETSVACHIGTARVGEIARVQERVRDDNAPFHNAKQR